MSSNEFTKKNTGRVTGLDLARGITIAAMIIVNNQGDWSAVYKALKHAPWDGFLGADFIFPSFLFIAGISLSISVKAAGGMGISDRVTAGRLFKRAALIFILGLILNFPHDLNFQAWRIPGVLQRIGLCLAMGIFPVMYLQRRGIIILAIVIGGIYWTMMNLIPAPGFPAGDLSPQGNLCRFIDSSIFGSHVYTHSPAKGFDPEGLLSTLGALSTLLAGAAAASFFAPENTDRKKIICSASAGAALLAAGAAASIVIPLNKNLWSPSYILLTGGITLLIIAASVLISSSGRMKIPSYPFISLGMNPLLIYFLASAAGKLTAYFTVDFNGTPAALKKIIFDSLISGWCPGPAGSLLYSVMFLSAFTLSAVILHRRGIFIKL